MIWYLIIINHGTYLHVSAKCLFDVTLDYLLTYMWFQEWTEDEGCRGDWIRASYGAREVKTEPEAGLSQGKRTSDGVREVKIEPEGGLSQGKRTSDGVRE